MGNQVYFLPSILILIMVNSRQQFSCATLLSCWCTQRLQGLSPDFRSPVVWSTSAVPLFMRLPESGLAYDRTIVQRASSSTLTPDLPSGTLDSETLFAACWLYILQQWPTGSK